MGYLYANRRRQGFTLIELLVSLSLVALLASVALPLTGLAAKREKELELSRSLRQIRQALDRYKDEVDAGKIKTTIGDSGYPPSLETLVDGVVDQTDLKGNRKIFFLRRIPRDPMCNCPERSAAETWTLRSYKSPPEQPEAGADVYDVLSGSTQEALNGTYYKDW